MVILLNYPNHDYKKNNLTSVQRIVLQLLRFSCKGLLSYEDFELWSLYLEVVLEITGRYTMANSCTTFELYAYFVFDLITPR